MIWDTPKSHNDKQRLSRTYPWVQLGRDVTRLYDRAFPVDVFQCELRKSSLLFCSDLTGANQNVGHRLSMWDMRQGMEMLCSPTKKVEQMISEYFQEKMNSLSHPKLQLLSRKISYGLLTEESRCCFASGGKYLCG